MSFLWMGLLSMIDGIGDGHCLRMSLSELAGRQENVRIQRVRRAARTPCEDFRVCREDSRDQIMVVFRWGRLYCL
jgi:hypothetical protein